jgi:hypothetical protein
MVRVLSGFVQKRGEVRDRRLQFAGRPSEIVIEAIHG